MERLHGVEVLRNYSFKDTSLPYEIALDKLSLRTQAAVGKNIDDLRAKQDYNSHRKKALRELDQLEQIFEIDTIRGGFSFNEDELNEVYESMGHLSYSEIVRGFGDDILPRFFGGVLSERTPGATISGYLLDITQIVNPDVVSYEDSIREMANSLRGTKTNPFMLGICFDDAINLRGTATLPHEFFMDSEEAKRFVQVYRNSINPMERKEFKQGLDLKIVAL
ncbi:hypothetical protein JXA63_00845 [Candidatus Woesebacteria bacterium]|nr:hypothetical protein [Candidatus Woesebacteria bacterium]